MLVPKVSLERSEPPTTPVFFNPAAGTNRDVSVAITEAAEGATFCDALAGVGARGVRVAKEVSRKMHVALVDFNGASLQLAKRNALLNGVGSRCRIVRAGANEFLYSRLRRDEKFGFVDVDPFGTPAPYIQAAFNAIDDGGIVSLTATDTAVLCGVHPRVARRRYGAATLNNAFHHETAIRILIGSCLRLAGALDIGVSPVAAHSTKHYVRVYLRAEMGATNADAAMGSEGYVMECPHCRHLFSGSVAIETCEKCGKRARRAGPLWVGKLVEEALVRRAHEVCDERGFAEAAKTLASLQGVDRFPPYGYSLARVCSSLKVASVPPSKVVQALASKGFRTASQPFEKSGLKTDADYEDVAAAVKEAAAKPSQ